MAWLADKEERKYLGHSVKSKMVDEIDKLTKEVNSLKRKAENLELKAETLKNLEEIMKTHGISTYSYSVERNLKEALKNGFPAHLLTGLRVIENEAKKLISSALEAEK
jgi:hypothetical protein